MSLFVVVPVLGVWLTVSAFACNAGDPQRTGDAPAIGASPAEPARALPTRPFVPPLAFEPAGDRGEAIPPPDLAQETWRALVNRHRPHQKKTPHWQPLPATETVELQMPSGSRYRCVVNPVEVTAKSDDFNSKLEAWTLMRTMLCSSDDFASWTEYGHRLRIAPDGSRQVLHDSEALLRERSTETTSETVVRIRSHGRQQKATTGPPRILQRARVDD